MGGAEGAGRAWEVEVEVRCLHRPIHSGRGGGAVPDPVQILCRLIASLPARGVKVARFDGPPLLGCINQITDAARARLRLPPLPGARGLKLAAYFLRLGALGFGGPVALASAMRRDLVDGRGWITEAEYDSGLAIAAACPGPLAYQLAVYCGYVRHGLAGALMVAVAFGLAPFCWWWRWPPSTRAWARRGRRAPSSTAWRRWW